MAPNLPDYELVRSIGQGGYGEVWLARSITGNYRAIKVIYRANFHEARPFEREFLGIQRFEPISRMHPGLVAILHVGRNEAAGHFHYVMELADDSMAGQRVDTARYRPKTLMEVLDQRRRLPIGEATELGVALTSALGFLHGCGLVHRDIKPSNIIFVNGVPKFADVGLVTKIDESSSYVGTAGYIPPEGPGSAKADIFSLGKVLYQVGMGCFGDEFPKVPESIGETTHLPELFRFNSVILKACEPDPSRRYRTAEEMHTALKSIWPGSPFGRGEAPPPNAATTKRSIIASAQTQRLKGMRVAVLYKANVPADAGVLERLQRELCALGCDVFSDKHLVVGVEWAREIEARIRGADAAVVLLSPSSVQSEMIAYEVEIAHESAQQCGRPRFIPVRLQLSAPLPSSLAAILDPLQYFLWQGPEDDDRLVGEIIRSLETTPPSPMAGKHLRLESIGGAVPLESRFYVVRHTDHEFQTAIARRDSIVLVKGARQMGKTSLLARGLQQARQAGGRVALTDFQKLNANHLASVGAFYLALGEFLADQLDLSVLPDDIWDKRRSANANFERYLRREVLEKIPGHLVWGLDEVDRLFTCDFGSEVFGLFRSWHNERALDPQGPWSRLTLAIAYATEAHLFITDINQSPFNVGTRVTLDDFTVQQVTQLNKAYEEPLRNEAEIAEFFRLLAGQPYLVRRGFNELAAGEISFDDFKAHADKEEGIFGDHLRRLLVLVAKDTELCEVVRDILRGQQLSPAGKTLSSFYRLRSAGLMRGDSPEEAHPRCEIYASYLRRHLR